MNKNRSFYFILAIKNSLKASLFKVFLNQNSLFFIQKLKAKAINNLFLSLNHA